MSLESLIVAGLVVYLLWRIARAVEEPIRRRDEAERNSRLDAEERQRLEEEYRKTGRWKGL